MEMMQWEPTFCMHCCILYILIEDNEEKYMKNTLPSNYHKYQESMANAQLICLFPLSRTVHGKVISNYSEVKFICR